MFDLAVWKFELGDDVWQRTKKRYKIKILDLFANKYRLIFKF